MILSEPTNHKGLSTYWLWAGCDLCGLLCEFEACQTAHFYNPKGGQVEKRPEGCKSEFTSVNDPIVNDLVSNHAVICHRWKVIRVEGKKFLICADCRARLRKERAA